MSLASKFLNRGSNALGAKGGTSAALKGGLGFAGFAGFDTYLNMKEGDDFGTAAVKGAATGMLWTVAPGPMWAATLAPLARDGAIAAAQWHKGKQDWWSQQHLPNFGGQYMDTQRAMTMRQAAVQQIQGSKLNARSALGGEAKLLGQNMFRT
jgi:hypothetical protein